LPPERPTEGILIGLRQNAGIPRIATTSVGSKYNGIDVQAIRNPALMRYARTLYDAARARITPAANDPYCGMVTRDTLKSSSGPEGPRDHGGSSAVGAESAIDTPGETLQGFEMLASGLVALRASGVMARISVVDPGLRGAQVTSILKSKGRAGAPASSSAGGGGVAAPWGILALLTVRVIRAPWGRERAGARWVRDRSSSGVARAVGE
jgi:hypothetical protein